MCERPANHLLTLLPEVDFLRLGEKAETVRVPLRTILADVGEPIREVLFPVSSVISSVVPMKDGAAIEAATIGREGMSGIDLLIDNRTSIYRTIQQIEGESYKIPAATFQAVLAASDPLRRLLERYALSLTYQTGQTSACNLRHDIETRLCRWLLMTHDRVGSDTFYLTHEFLSIMLGVRRQSISEIAARLQHRRLISYRRGHITILDRPGLEESACECYDAVNETYRQVMGVPVT